MSDAPIKCRHKLILKGGLSWKVLTCVAVQMGGTRFLTPRHMHAALNTTKQQIR